MTEVKVSTNLGFAAVRRILRTVARAVEPGPGDLTARDGEFMAKDQDLGVLRRLAAAEPAASQRPERW
jgi:hypothetical protein